MIGIARNLQSDAESQSAEPLPYHQAHTEPALPQTAIKSGRGKPPEHRQLVSILEEEFDAYQEEAEVALLRGSARHARSLLIDSSW